MRTEGFIKPNDGRVQKWGPNPSACQQLGGISLFDFSTEPIEKVLGEANKWQQFLGCARPLTVVLGLERTRLTVRLMPYPENKEDTTGPVIPWVEVCASGDIPITAVKTHILVCSVDLGRFYVHQALSESTLSKAEEEFETLLRIY
jgi:hypothetical protein